MVVEDAELSLKILKILPIQTLSFFFTTLELEPPLGTPNSLSLVLYTQITSWLNGLRLTFFWPPITIPSPSWCVIPLTVGFTSRCPATIENFEELQARSKLYDEPPEWDKRVLGKALAEMVSIPNTERRTLSEKWQKA